MSIDFTMRVGEVACLCVVNPLSTQAAYKHALISRKPLSIPENAWNLNTWNFRERMNIMYNLTTRRAGCSCWLRGVKSLNLHVISHKGRGEWLIFTPKQNQMSCTSLMSSIRPRYSLGHLAERPQCFGATWKIRAKIDFVLFPFFFSLLIA